MEPINNEELLALLQTLGTSIQRGMGTQQDLGAKVNMIDGRVEFLNQLVLNQLEQLRKEWTLSSTSISAKLTEIDKQVGVLQDNQKRLEAKVYKEDNKGEDKKPTESLGRFIIGKVMSHPGVATFIVILMLTGVGWVTALIEHFTGRDIEPYPYPTLENKGPVPKE
jgi:hypothetical protein